MAEFAIRMVDKVNEDFYLDLGCGKRGDVISVCPDGWNWGTAERVSPYRIVKIPGLVITDAQWAKIALSEREIEGLPESKRTHRKRGWTVDVSGFPPGDAPVVLTKSQALALVRRKPPVVEP